MPPATPPRRGRVGRTTARQTSTPKSLTAPCSRPPRAGLRAMQFLPRRTDSSQVASRAPSDAWYGHRRAFTALAVAGLTCSACYLVRAAWAEKAPGPGGTFPSPSRRTRTRGARAGDRSSVARRRQHPPGRPARAGPARPPPRRGRHRDGQLRRHAQGRGPRGHRQRPERLPADERHARRLGHRGDDALPAGEPRPGEARPGRGRQRHPAGVRRARARQPRRPREQHRATSRAHGALRSRSPRHGRRRRPGSHREARQRQSHPGSPGRRGVDRHPARVGLDDRADDRQPQPAAAGLAARDESTR